MRLPAIVLAMALLPSAARAADTTTNPHPGIKRVKRTTSSQNINILVVDLCAPGVSIRATKSGERQRTVSSFGALVKAQAVVNGDFFSFSNYSTNGPSMGDGEKWGGTDHNYVAPLQFGRNKAALPAHGSTAGVEAWAEQVVSGHPSVLVNGARRDNNGDPLCTARHPRTAAGLSADKSKLILAVVDGRATGRIGYTCDELAALMKEFGADDAMNLDGGGSSTMWIAGPGVVNFPSDGTQRVVANHLAIRATGTGEAPNCPKEPFAANFVATNMNTDEPLVVRGGDESMIWLELDNTGDMPWTASTRVGTQDPQDRDSVFAGSDWLSPNRATGADEMFAPGTRGRFTFSLVAPEVYETTTFEETFQLVEEGVTWFGPKQTISITVNPAPADIGGGCQATGRASPWLALAVLALRRRKRRRTSAA